MAEQEMGSDTNRTTVTISVGVASFPEHGENSESVIRNADAALYEAKKRGRNQTIIAGDGRKARKQKQR
jgi:diguanylate cyclase (GGDEF)-like protein